MKIITCLTVISRFVRKTFPELKSRALRLLPSWMDVILSFKQKEKNSYTGFASKKKEKLRITIGGLSVNSIAQLPEKISFKSPEEGKKKLVPFLKGLLNAVWGLFYHELGHVLFTDFREFTAQAAKFEIAHPCERWLFLQVFNILEDPMVEMNISTLMKQERYWDCTNPNVFFKYMKDIIFMEDAKKYCDLGDASSFLNYMLLLLRVGKKNVPGACEVWEIHSHDLIEKIREFYELDKDSAGRVVKAYEFCEWLLTNVTEIPWTVPTPPVKSPYTPIKPGGGTGEYGPIMPGGPSLPGGGSSSVDEGGASSGTSSSGAPSGTSSSGGKSGGTDSAGGKDESEAADDKARDKGDDPSGEAGDKGSGSDESEGDDKDSDKGDDGDEDGEGDGAGDGDEEDPSPLDDDDVPSGEEASEIPDDVKEEIEEVFNEEITIDDDHEWIIVKDCVEINDQGLIDNFIEKFLEKFEDSIVGIGEALALLRGRVRPKLESGFTRGKLDVRRAMRAKAAGVPDLHIFQQKVTNGAATDVSVTLICDCSGSMSGEKSKLSTGAALVVGEACERAKIPFECLGFNATQDCLSGTHLTLQAKAFDEPFQEAKNFIGCFSQDLLWRAYREVVPCASYSGNCEEVNLYYIRKHLEKVHHQKKVVFVFCDGQTTGSAEVLKEVVMKMTAEGMVVVGIGIMSSDVKNIYPLYKVFNSLKELEEELGPYLIDTISHYAL